MFPWLPFRKGDEQIVANNTLLCLTSSIARLGLFCLTLLSLGVIASPASAWGQSQTPSAWRVTHQPAQLVNGAPVLFEIKAPKGLSQLQATWFGHTVLFRQSGSCKCWYGIAGVEYSAKPGKYPLELEGTSTSGGKIQYSQPMIVAAAIYPSTTIKVPQQFVEPPKETMPRIEEEQKVKKEAFQSTAPEPLWTGVFKAPADLPTSGVYGSSRLYNGVKRNPHFGLDFRATTGTPVHAANAGTVVIARPLYFEGNCVAIDHGQGLMTLYFHLSEFKVKEGEKVERGQLIALSGGTGRSTAPHLHFAVRWQGEYLNPATLLKITPP